MGNVTPIKKTTSEPVWLSPAEVASRVPGMTVENLSEMRKRREGPPYYKPTLRTVIYLEAEIDSWVASSRVNTGDKK